MFSAVELSSINFVSMEHEIVVELPSFDLTAAANNSWKQGASHLDGLWQSALNMAGNAIERRTNKGKMSRRARKIARLKKGS